MSLRKNFNFSCKLRGTVSNRAVCYPSHSPVFTHLRVGFEKSQKIVIFWIFLHPSLDEQYGKIGFPNNKDLSNSSDVVYVHEYTRDDGTVVKAHYRSKAGQGDPNKPAMSSLKEYKKDLDKRVEDYMTRDAAMRYGKPALQDKNLSIGMPYSSGLHNVSISNADGKLIPKKPPLSEELAQKYTEIEEIINMAKDKKNQYEYLTSPSMFKLQRDVEKHPKKVGALKTILPDAVDTYMGNLTQGKNYEKENENKPKNLSKISQVTKVSDLRNKEIKDFIYGTYKRIKPDDTLVVLSNNSKASERLKADVDTRDVIRANLKKIKNGDYKNKFLGINYSTNLNMKAAYGKLSIFNPHIDENNNLVMYAVDYDDYEESSDKTGYLNAINDNAYKLQESGIVKPYLKIIEIKYTPEELKGVLSK